MQRGLRKYRPSSLNVDLRSRPECLGHRPNGISILHPSQIFAQCHIAGLISWSPGSTPANSRPGLRNLLTSRANNPRELDRDEGQVQLRYRRETATASNREREE